MVAVVMILSVMIAAIVAAVVEVALVVLSLWLDCMRLITVCSSFPTS